jgi:hypothetical protein
MSKTLPPDKQTYKKEQVARTRKRMVEEARIHDVVLPSRQHLNVLLDDIQPEQTDSAD